MKNIVKKFLIALCVLTLMLSIITIPVSAATGNINLGYSGTANPGNEITVKLTVSYTKGLYAYDTTVRYDNSCLKLVSLVGSSNDVVANAAGSFGISLFDASAPKNLVCQMKFKVLKVGNTSVSVDSGIAGDIDALSVNIPAKSLNVYITAPTKSSDNTLKSIKKCGVLRIK